jgi:hypothetical protein
MDYKSNMNVYEKNMNVMIQDFYTNYADLIELSKHHMGDLFNPYDYPDIDELRSKFGFRLVFSPLPESGDFRLDIPNADMQELASNYESSFKDRLSDAMREPWDKLHKALTHLSEKLTDEEGDEQVEREEQAENPEDFRDPVFVKVHAELSAFALCHAVGSGNVVGQK